MRRISPDKTVRHGHHLDHYWPGLIQSIWKTRFGVRVLRTREYADLHHQKLRETSWQVSLHRDSLRAGLRVEVDDPPSWL